MRSLLVLLALLLSAPVMADVREVASRAQFHGVILVEQGGRAKPGFGGSLLPERKAQRRRDFENARFTNSSSYVPRDWRWASVTKQVVAVLIMQEVERGRLDLDKPLAAYLPGFRSANAATATVRQLLQHRAGLPNPDDTKVAPESFPAFYRRDWKQSRDPLTGYCAGTVTGAPGGNWAYNNCDYIVAGALLQAITGKSWGRLVRERIARPLGASSLRASQTGMDSVPGFTDERPEPPFDLRSFGAAGSLIGEADDLVKFDRALLNGKLLKPETRAELWRADPKLGFMALGQWVFDAPLKGCAGTVKIVERRGEIGAIGVRNFILPDKDMIVVAFTNRGGFDFGEIWQGRGFAYDLLSAAACSA